MMFFIFKVESMTRFIVLMTVRDIAARNDFFFNSVQTINNNAYVVEGRATVVFRASRRWSFREGEVACLTPHVERIAVMNGRAFPTYFPSKQTAQHFGGRMCVFYRDVQVF
jgi:hypothetical protein